MITRFIVIACTMPVMGWAQIQKDKTPSGLSGKVKTIKETEYKIKNDPEKKRLSVTTVYNYNGDGREIEEIVHDRADKLAYRLKINYDENGHRTTTEETLKHDRPGNHSTYTYYTHGQIKEQDEYGPGSNLLNKHLFFCDNDGRQTEYDSYNQDGELEFKTLNTYDSKGVLSEEKYYDGDGNLEFKITYTYDSDGEEKELVFYTPDGKIDHKLSYKRENPDSQGNWLKETTYENDKCVAINEREITYY